MPEPKLAAETVDLNQQEIQKKLLERREQQLLAVGQQIESLSGKIDEARAESAERGVHQKSFNDTTSRELSQIRRSMFTMNERMGRAETSITELQDADNDHARSQSEADLEREATIAGAITHVHTLDTNLIEIKSEFNQQNERSGTRWGHQDQINNAVCSTLGIDYLQLTTGTKPEDDAEAQAAVEKATPKTDLVKVAAENRLSAVLALVTFLTVLGQLILKALGK